MSKQEIKEEISRVLDHFSDKALGELLSFLKTLDSKDSATNSSNLLLDKILKEDRVLLSKLAQ